MCVEEVSMVAASNTKTMVGVKIGQPCSAANSSRLKRAKVRIAHAIGVGISKICRRDRPLSVIGSHEWRRRSRARHE